MKYSNRVIGFAVLLAIVGFLIQLLAPVIRETLPPPTQSPYTPRTEYATPTPEQLSNRRLIATVFADVPQMVRTVDCESDFRQFDDKGKPLLSPTSDVGIMQINQVHWDEAKRLRLDIFHSMQDNITMGRIVYKKQGITAWMCYSGTS